MAAFHGSFLANSKLVASNCETNSDQYNHVICAGFIIRVLKLANRPSAPSSTVSDASLSASVKVENAKVPSSLSSSVIPQPAAVVTSNHAMTISRITGKEIPSIILDSPPPAPRSGFLTRPRVNGDPATGNVLASHIARSIIEQKQKLQLHASQTAIFDSREHSAPGDLSNRNNNSSTFVPSSIASVQQSHSKLSTTTNMTTDSVSIDLVSPKVRALLRPHQTYVVDILIDKLGGKPSTKERRQDGMLSAPAHDIIENQLFDVSGAILADEVGTGKVGSCVWPSLYIDLW